MTDRTEPRPCPVCRTPTTLEMNDDGVWEYIPVPAEAAQGAAPRAEGLKREAAAATPSLDPSEIRDLDMALRYALLDHDMECRAIGMENNCTCPARGHFDRARATVKRIGAPYRKPSGDYDLGDES